MSGFSDGKELDIARNIKLIEELKGSILTDIANLYVHMAKAHSQREEIENDIADTIINTYLLSSRLGLNCSDIEALVVKKLKIRLLKEGALDFDIKEILDYFEGQ